MTNIFELLVDVREALQRAVWSDEPLTGDAVDALNGRINEYLSDLIYGPGAAKVGPVLDLGTISSVITLLNQKNELDNLVALAKYPIEKQTMALINLARSSVASHLKQMGQIYAPETPKEGNAL